MKKSRKTTKQIIRILREADSGLSTEKQDGFAHERKYQGIRRLSLGSLGDSKIVHPSRAGKVERNRVTVRDTMAPALRQVCQ